MNETSSIPALVLVPFESIHAFMEPLCKRLNELDIDAVVMPNVQGASNRVKIEFKDFIGKSSILLTELLEHVIQQLPIQFELLPLLVEGESKVIKQFNSKMVVERFK